MADREMTLEEMVELYNTWDFDRLFNTYSEGKRWQREVKALSDYEFTQLMMMRQVLKERVFAFRDVI